MNHTICIVFVCNKAYFYQFIKTCSELITNGKYKGPICLVIGNDLINDTLLQNEIIVKNNIIVKYFTDISFPNKFLEINNTIDDNNYIHINKKFQWHKLHLFNTFFKQWDYMFYIDCGMTIFSDISPILNERKENTIVAHSDSYPTYEWKLDCQFYKKNIEYFSKLNSNYNLNINYFQTGIMLYDTKLIDLSTFNNLYNLALEYPISRTNEQGIIALYFTNIIPCFKQLRIHNETTFFYDYWSRDPNNKYIMTKR